MKRILTGILVYAVIAVWAAPLATAVIDMFAWFFVGHAVIVEWNSDRYAFLVGWTLFLPIIVLMIMGAIAG